MSSTLLIKVNPENASLVSIVPMVTCRWKKANLVSYIGYTESGAFFVIISPFSPSIFPLFVLGGWPWKVSLHLVL